MMQKREPRQSCDDDGIDVLRTVTRAVTPPVMVLLLAGLSAALSERLAEDMEAAAALSTLPLQDLTSPSLLEAPLGLLTAGLLLLATAPTLTVLLLTLAHGRGRRWREATIAASVLAILFISVAFKPH